MNTSRLHWPLLLAMGSILVACDKDVEEEYDDLVEAPQANTVVAMSMSFTRGGSAFDPSVGFTDAAGTLVELRRLKFYMSQPVFTGDAGDTVASFPQKYLLFDLAQPGVVQNIGEVDAHLERMHIALGIDSVTNHSDPLTMAPPLNATFMWWGWATGHLFLLMEGKYDSTGDGVVDNADGEFTFHCGMDTMYTPTQFVVDTDADMGGNVILPFTLRIDSLFSQLDVAADPSIMVVHPTTLALMQRLKAGLTPNP